jgi:Ca2+-binding RTX toxin-like protein
MLNLHTLKLSLVAVTVATAWAIAQPAHADVTCTEGGRVLTVKMTQDGDVARISTSGQLIFVDAGGGRPVTCTGTVGNTFLDTILVNDVSDDPSTPAAYDGTTTVVIDEPAAIAPGHVVESTAPSEIEFLTDMKSGEDELILEGDKPQVIAVGDGGIDWNNDTDADMVGMPFKHVELRGSGAADILSGQGGAGIGAPLSTSTSFQVLGFAGSDTLEGSDSAGGDDLQGGEGPDEIAGAAGGDFLTGDQGDDLLNGGAGADAVRFSAGTGVTVDLAQTGEQNTGEGRDTLTAVESAYGGGGADHLSGDAGANQLDGGGGDDVLDGRGGADELRGGEGSDTVSYADAPEGVNVDLSRGDQVTDGDRIYFVENVIGSPFGDTLTGNDLGNRILGGAGADVIASGLGVDTIEVRDGEGDRVSCGGNAFDSTGVDTVVGDRRSLDTIAADCESVDALPEPLQADQPGQPTNPGTDTPDTTLSFTLAGAGRQRLLRQKAVHVKVACPQEACTIVATASGKLRLRPVTSSVAAGATRTLKLRLTRKQLAVVRKAFAAGRRPSLTVSAQARDGAGNTVSRTKRVTAVR